jgi:hypothetical protein
MSKRHQSSRRRTYGRRQHELHELHERTDRLAVGTDWLGGSDLPTTDEHRGSGPAALGTRRAVGGWPQLQGID